MVAKKTLNLIKLMQNRWQKKNWMKIALKFPYGKQKWNLPLNSNSQSNISLKLKFKMCVSG